MVERRINGDVGSKPTTPFFFRPRSFYSPYNEWTLKTYILKEDETMYANYNYKEWTKELVKEQKGLFAKLCMFIALKLKRDYFESLIKATTENFKES